MLQGDANSKADTEYSGAQNMPTASPAKDTPKMKSGAAHFAALNRREALATLTAGAFVSRSELSAEALCRFGAIDHLALAVDDPEKSVRFCARVFGNTVLKEKNNPRQYVKLGPNYIAMAPPGDGFAHNLLGTTIRVNISRIEQIYARVQADIDELASPFDIGIAPRSKEFVAAAESAGSETQCRNF